MENKHDRIYRPGRSGVLLACLIAATLSAQVGHAENGPPLQLTLAQALERAFRASPILRAREAEVRQAEARLLAARIYPFNPELELESTDRIGQGTASTERGIAPSQEIEIGGRRRKRIAVASAFLEGAESRFARQKRLLAAQGEVAFAEALSDVGWHLHRSHQSSRKE